MKLSELDLNLLLVFEAVLETRSTTLAAAHLGLTQSAVSRQIRALVEAEQEATLAIIQQIDPVFVDITQSSVALTRLKRELAAGSLAAAGAGGRARRF